LLFRFACRLASRKDIGMATPIPLLKLSEVTKRYDSVGGADSIGVPVLDGISLEVARGESLAIVGPSGSGKSTLLQIIGTLDRPTAGRVELDGQDLSALGENQLAEVRNRQIGFVFQSHFLLPQCTVLENVLVPTLAIVGHASSLSPNSIEARPGSDAARARGESGRMPVPQEAAPDRARRLLERVGLSHRLDHLPGQLSGGERQRVAVVRALINAPQLLLADEPTGALDHASATSLGQLLVDLNREEGVTLIVVTHALDLARRMGKVIELRDGKLASPGARKP
jgi:lipoprotein-releasing system ATP-binding protein